MAIAWELNMEYLVNDWISWYGGIGRILAIHTSDSGNVLEVSGIGRSLQSISRYIDLRTGPSAPDHYTFRTPVVITDKYERVIRRYTGDVEDYVVQAIISRILASEPLINNGSRSVNAMVFTKGDVLGIWDWYGVILEVFTDTATGEASLLHVQTTRNVLRGIAEGEFNDVRISGNEHYTHATKDDLVEDLERWRKEYLKIENIMLEAIGDKHE